MSVVSALVALALPLMAQPSSAAPRVVLARTKTSTALPSSTDATSVQSVTLAGGPWTVVGKAFVVDLTSGESDFFRCELFNATSGKHLDVAAAWVSGVTQVNMITNIAKLKVAMGTTATIQQRCWHDHEGIAHAYIDPGATLLGIKAPSATQNRLYRSTESVSLPPFGSTTVASLGLTAGTWVYGFKATAVNLSTDRGQAQCSLPGGKTTRQSVGTTNSWPRVATFAGFGVITSATATTITVSCAAPILGPYLDPGLVLWARQVPSAVTGDSCGTVLGASSTTSAVADMRTASCTIGFGTGASQVGGTAITPGAWTVLGAEQGTVGAQYGGFVRCRATNPGANKVLDAHADLMLNADGQFVAGTTYLGKLTTTVPTTVEFRCGLPGTGVVTAGTSDGGYVVFKA